MGALVRNYVDQISFFVQPFSSLVKISGGVVSLRECLPRKITLTLAFLDTPLLFFHSIITG